MSPVTEEQAAAPMGRRGRTRGRLSFMGRCGGAIVGLWMVVAAAGPYVAPFHEADVAGMRGFASPDATFWLGTDYLGRDLLSRILWGARTTIGIAFAADILAFVIGVTFGVAAAVGGGRIDSVLSRVNDVLISIPHVMAALVVIAVLGSSVPILIVMTGLVYASPVFRVARALAQDIAVMDYVDVARLRGEGLAWIVLREIVPNAAMPLLTDFGLRLLYILLFVSSLSFLGLGVQPPASDWGSMVRENLPGLVYGSISPLAPAIAIATLTMSINVIVDDLSARSGGRLTRWMA
jgi:peptide/nickel transport system permease protein